jgi:hypothetical protein
VSETGDCPRLIEAQRLWEGEIAPQDAGEVRGHLAYCAVCRTEYEGWERLSRHLARTDPALPLDDERLRGLKEQLLQRCAASREEAGEVVSSRNTPWSWGGRWRLLARLALALPAAAVALLLFHAGRTVPLREPRPAQVDARPAPLPRPEPEVALSRPAPVAPRSPKIALAPERPAQAAQSRPRVSRLTGKRPRISVSPGRRKGTIRLRPALTVGAPRQIAAAEPPWEGRRRSGPPPPAPPPTSGEGSPGSAPFRDIRPPYPPARVADAGGTPALPGIERIVIQVDGPPPPETRTVTHVTIIASGDLEAPDAELTIVRSKREESTR